MKFPDIFVVRKVSNGFIVCPHYISDKDLYTDDDYMVFESIERLTDELKEYFRRSPLEDLA